MRSSPSRLKKSTLFLGGLAAGLVPLSFGVDDVPSNVRIVLPPALAARLAQESLGQPTGNGDSTVRIPVKKTISARAKRVQIKKVPEVLKLYGGSVFALNFEKPFELDLRIMGLVSQGDVRIKSLRFSEASRGDDRVLIDVEMELRHLRVQADEIWAAERGLTPGLAPAPGQGCPIGRSPLDRFVKHNAGARVFAPKISEISPERGDHPVTVKGRFEAVYASPKAGAPRALELRAVSVAHDVADVLIPHYRLEARLEAPNVQIFQMGECYPDPSKGAGIRALFQTLLEKIKQEVVRGVSEELTKIALQEATRAFAKLNIPVEKDIPIYRREFPPLEVPRMTNPAVSTYVHHDYPVEIERIAKTAPRSPAPVRKSDRVARNILWNVNERLLLGGLGAANGGLDLALGDQLTLNARTEAAVKAVDEGTFPALAPEHLRIIFNRSFFASKVDLVESLRDERAALLPPEIVLGSRGLEVHPNSGSRLSLVAHIEVHLKKMSGLKGFAARAIEYFAGNTDGIYRLPLQLDLRPEIVEDAAGRALRLHLAIRENFFETQFGDRGNLDDAAGFILGKVAGKLREVAEKLKAKPIDVDLDPIEKKAPLRLRKVVFSDRGALAVDVEPTSVRGLIKKKKPTETATQTAAETAAEITGVRP